MHCPEGITGLCRQVGISRGSYYHWQRTLLEKGKEGLISRRNGKSDPQKAKLIQENQQLKALVANLSVENLILKKKIDGRVIMEKKAYQRSQAEEKFEILETVASCPLSIRKACHELGIPRATFQRWKRAYQERGLEGLKDIPSITCRCPHRKIDEKRQKILECANIHTNLGSKSLAPYLWDEYRAPSHQRPSTTSSRLKAG